MFKNINKLFKNINKIEIYLYVITVCLVGCSPTENTDNKFLNTTSKFENPYLNDYYVEPPGGGSTNSGVYDVTNNFLERDRTIIENKFNNQSTVKTGSKLISNYNSTFFKDSNLDYFHNKSILIDPTLINLPKKTKKKLRSGGTSSKRDAPLGLVINKKQRNISENLSVFDNSNSIETQEEFFENDGPLLENNSDENPIILPLTVENLNSHTDEKNKNLDIFEDQENKNTDESIINDDGQCSIFTVSSRSPSFLNETFEDQEIKNIDESMMEDENSNPGLNPDYANNNSFLDDIDQDAFSPRDPDENNLDEEDSDDSISLSNIILCNYYGEIKNLSEYQIDQTDIEYINENQEQAHKDGYLSLKDVRLYHFDKKRQIKTVAHYVINLLFNSEKELIDSRRKKENYKYYHLQNSPTHIRDSFYEIFNNVISENKRINLINEESELSDSIKKHIKNILFFIDGNKENNICPSNEIDLFTSPAALGNFIIFIHKALYNKNSSITEKIEIEKDIRRVHSNILNKRIKKKIEHSDFTDFDFTENGFEDTFNSTEKKQSIDLRNIFNSVYEHQKNIEEFANHIFFQDELIQLRGNMLRCMQDVLKSLFTHSVLSVYLKNGYNKFNILNALDLSISSLHKSLGNYIDIYKGRNNSNTKDTYAETKLVQDLYSFMKREIDN